MDLFDAIMDKLIPAIIIFVMLRNILGSIFGKRRSEEPEDADGSGEEYQDEDSGADSVPEDYDGPEEEQQESGLSREQQQILDEFERMLKQDKSAPEGSPRDGQAESRETQKVLRDEDVTVHRDEQYEDQVLTDEETRDRVHRDGDGCQTVHQDGDGCDVIHRDDEALEHDKGKVYAEGSFIEGPAEPVPAEYSSSGRQGSRAEYRREPYVPLRRKRRSRLMNGIILSEILAGPKGVR